MFDSWKLKIAIVRLCRYPANVHLEKSVEDDYSNQITFLRLSIDQVLGVWYYYKYYRRLLALKSVTKGLPTASSAAIRAHIAPSLGAPVSSRIIRRRLDEGHLGRQSSLRVLLLTPPRPSTPPFGVVLRTRKLGSSGMEPCQL
ncbi:HTH_Tnp_Tc3_2 domain-containing protein [Trichonephila clavipes]|nr:HTH_Tnp_Tc3_2 domain-containing protein [Trichonephila clavipes]